MKLIKKLGTLTLFLLTTFLLSSCSDNDDIIEPVIADFTTSVNIVNNEAVVTINNTSQNATSYQWSFPNGTPEVSTEANPTVTYTANGTYSITLIAKKGAEIDTKTAQVIVSGIEATTENVIANFTTSVNIVNNEAVVTINNTSQNATSYQWSFPNGTPESSTEANPTVTYTANGTYSITLVAKNGTETDTKTVEITVNSICIDGEGTVTTQVLSLSNFNKIDLASSFNVTVSQGATQEIKAIGHPNIIAKLKTEVSNNTWKIDLEGGCYNNFELAIEITVPNIELLKICGSGSIIANDFTNQNALEALITRSGSMTLNGFEGITSFNATINGSGSFTANKDITTLETLTLINSKSGAYSGFNLSSNNATVTSSGSGSSELTVVNTLNATLSGSGNVSYKGTPTITQSITGTGTLINAN